MHFKTAGLTVLAALALAACGGGDGPRYQALVSFGDSLSDVGSYRTPGIAALGGGKYTVNGAAQGVWVEQLATALDLPAPCAAQTGLQATGVFADLAAPVADHPACTAYGQGGSRVTDPIGPWNAALAASPDPAVAFTGQLGQLTVPVATQIANHLAAHGGRFTGAELVTVLAGANDLLVHADAMGAAIAGAANQEQAAAAVQQTMAAMAQAATELAQLIREQIVAKGATRVAVLNLPNVSRTPAMLAAEAAAPGTQALVDQMTQTFNAALAAGLQGTQATVAQIDLYAENTRQVATPANYGLTNVTTPACTNTFPNAPGFLAPSLTCTTATTLPGQDTSRYLFADTVHPTPYGHTLLRDMVLAALDARGWR
ncbi:SGNH/GDSL hydrolase family protein [Pseudorhodoferax sp.]|uniref:SGNH/GDSL hydrolase family protein n=1 Tax=Pseudorhodoferax sp. TaxID=1993553 RepID=UPI0039E554DE